MQQSVILAAPKPQKICQAQSSSMRHNKRPSKILSMVKALTAHLVDMHTYDLLLIKREFEHFFNSSKRCVGIAGSPAKRTPRTPRKVPQDAHHVISDVRPVHAQQV